MKKHSIQLDLQSPSDQFTDKDLFLESENQCCLCGSDIEFEHIYDFAEHSVTETAHCSKCQIQLREGVHTLH